MSSRFRAFATVVATVVKAAESEEWKTSSTSTTTPLPTNPDDLTVQQRASEVVWTQSTPLVHEQDGMRLKEACLNCQADKVEEFMGPKWGFDVNREFGVVDQRSWTCLHWASMAWVKNKQVMDRGASVADISGDCKKTLTVLKSKPTFDLDHRGDFGQNALDLAYSHDNFDLADYLVSLGEELAVREGGVPNMCSSTCLFALAPPETTIAEFKRFSGPKGSGGEKESEANKDEYFRYNLHKGQMLNKLRWCRFFRDNNLKCPSAERENVLPVLGTKLGTPPQNAWAGAKLRELFNITAAEHDAEALKYDHWSIWDWVTPAVKDEFLTKVKGKDDL